MSPGSYLLLANNSFSSMATLPIFFHCHILLRLITPTFSYSVWVTLFRWSISVHISFIHSSFIYPWFIFLWLILRLFLFLMMSTATVLSLCRSLLMPSNHNVQLFFLQSQVHFVEASRFLILFLDRLIFIFTATTTGMI